MPRLKASEGARGRDKGTLLLSHSPKDKGKDKGTLLLSR